jgi:hypothetical protein
MADLTEPEIATAEKRGRLAQGLEPRAASARYDRAAGTLVIDLTSGASLTVPVRLVQGLDGASPDALAAIEILGSGYGLHWESLDVDLSIPGLLAGIFGTQRHMAQRAGRATSAAKAAAARANGAKGGRPRKRA